MVKRISDRKIRRSLNRVNATMAHYNRTQWPADVRVTWVCSPQFGSTYHQKQIRQALGY